MSSATPKCRIVSVFAFRGDRSPAFVADYLKKLNDQKNGTGPGPTDLECLQFAGHTAVSTDLGTTKFGFNPDGGNIAAWQLLDGLKNGDAFPGVIRDDTAIFTAVASRGLPVLSFEVILPDPQFNRFQGILASEGKRKRSRYRYGFPNGDGDCNCTTWLERLGLPLLTGRMSEFVSLSGISLYPTRRFGECV